MSVVERVSLESWTPPWLRHQHLARYRWACGWAPDARIVDAACGTGFGSQMLLQSGAASVTGIDVDVATVKTANRKLATRGLDFVQADVRQLPLANNSVDLYTSFETIEHVEDDAALVAEAARVLRPGGRLLCSTPNRLITNPRTTIEDQPFNRFHLREYTREELDALLRQHFREVRWRGQSYYSRRWQRILGCLAGIHRMLGVRCHQARKLAGLPWERAEWHAPQSVDSDRQPEYLVAECIR